MARPVALLVCALLGAACASPLNQSDKEQANVSTSFAEGKAFQDWRYTFGDRTADDEEVVRTNMDNFYPPLEDAIYYVTYPTQGVGKVVTSVVIDVHQDSKYSKVYVVDGGIGQRFIKIAIEAKEVSQLSYGALIFAE